MNLFILAGIVGVLTIFLGIALAVAFVRLSQMVTENEMVLEADKSAFNPSQTFGFEIPLNVDVTEQLSAARKLAAQRAAAMPRGSNMRIGRLGATNLKTAGKSLDEDPLSAVKIAAYHSWQGAQSGPPAGGVPEEQQAVRRQAQPAPTKKPEDLVPGEDYPFVEVTDDMSGDEVRRARISNARARAAAVKALKQQAAAAPAAEAAPAEEAAPAAEAEEPAASEAVAAAGIEEPDYVEITDDMEADEVRKARIQNARARSAYMKALKEAGIDPSEVQDGGGAPAPAKEEAPPAEEAPATKEAPAAEAEAPSEEEAGTIEIPAHIAEPDYMEITDDMAADEVRQARVHNSRERSKFYKALKEAGIDPKKVAEQQQ